MLCERGNGGGKVLKEYKDGVGSVKGGYGEEGLQVGGEELEGVGRMKRKKEVIGEMVGLVECGGKKVMWGVE